MVRGVLFVAVGLCACAEPVAPPSFERLVEVRHEGDLLVDVHDLDSGALGYVVKFTNEHGLPTELVYNAQQILATGTQPFESLIGTAIYPARTASGELAEDPEAVVVVDLDGPAIARARVTYAAPYQCFGNPQHLSGTSTFTFFPGGRIVRFDDVKANDAMLDPNPACEGRTDSNYFFTSYWTFLDGSTITGPDDLAPAALDPYGQTSACLSYPGIAVKAAIQWGGSATRILTGDAENPQDRFVFDFESAVASIDAGRRGMIGSALQLASDVGVPCQALLDALADRMVRIDDRAAVLDRSGFYADSDGATYGELVTIRGGSQPVPRGFVISLAGVHEHLRVRTTQPYVPQLDRAGGRTLVWFRDELGPGETIELELLE